MIDLSKQRKLDADQKAIQQIKFNGNLDRAGGSTMFFFDGEAKEDLMKTQYNTLDIKLCNSQLIKLKSAVKNGTEVTLNHSSYLIGSSNDETNFPNKLSLKNV